MKVLSLGVGVQSTALYYMSCRGELPKVDAAIFADPGGERTATRIYLKGLLEWQRKFDGIPILVIADKNLHQDLAELKTRKRFASIPAFTLNEDGSTGMLRRQCTTEYKVAQVNKGIRQLYGLQPRKRFPATEVWIGITVDEADRVFQPEEKWKTHRYPFIGYDVTSTDFTRIPSLNMSRANVLAWYERTGIEAPPKSGCLFCPFQSDSAWRRMKAEDPEDFAKAIAVDIAIRDASKAGVERPIYLHKSARPLAEVEFNQAELFEDAECSGYCHT